jgi:hypothetical protein
MGNVGRAIKRFPVFLLKTVYLLLFIILGVWLLQMVYFPELDIKKTIVISPPPETEDVFGKILRQTELVLPGHFHMIDTYVTQREPNPPLCLTCHGTYPHSKEAKVRSILNSHTGFIACSVCHTRKDPAMGDLFFKWVDRNTGMITDQIEGQYGKYSAKIFPAKTAAGGQDTIFRPVNEEAAQQFLKFKDQYTPDQIAQAKVKLHDHITAQPVFCSDCHQKDGYLDFVKLGFPAQRIHHLNSTEVVGLVEKYKTFYIPAQIDFGSEKALE